MGGVSAVRAIENEPERAVPGIVLTERRYAMRRRYAMSELLHYARNELGLPMRGIHAGRHIGYTLDAEKATAMRERGAAVIRVAAQTKDGPTGWEISIARSVDESET